MKTLPDYARLSALALAVFAAAAMTYAAPSPKAGDHPNPKSREPHPGDSRSAEGKARADAAKKEAQEKSALDRYDTNRNGKLDPDEVAAMQADRKSNGKGRGKKSS